MKKIFLLCIGIFILGRCYAAVGNTFRLPDSLVVTYGPETSRARTVLPRNVYIQSEHLTGCLRDFGCIPKEGFPLSTEYNPKHMAKVFTLMHAAARPESPEESGEPFRYNPEVVNTLVHMRLEHKSEEKLLNMLEIMHYLNVQSDAAMAIAVECHGRGMLQGITPACFFLHAIRLYKQFHFASLAAGERPGTPRIEDDICVRDVPVDAMRSRRALSVPGTIDISNFGLISLAGIEDISHEGVTMIRLQGNHFRNVDLSHFAALTHLDLSGNNLTEVPMLPEGIVILDVKNNRITDIEQLLRKPELREIDISGNRISTSDLARITREYANAQITIYPQYSVSYIGKKVLQVGVNAAALSLLWMLSKKLK